MNTTDKIQKIVTMSPQPTLKQYIKLYFTLKKMKYENEEDIYIIS